MKIRVILIGLGFLLGFQNLNSQTIFRLSYLKFTGETNTTIKPGFCPEIGLEFLSESERFWFGATIGYFVGTTRRDTFPTWGTNGFTFEPGYSIISKYRNTPLTFVTDFLIFRDKEISPIIGLDLATNFISFESESNYGYRSNSACRSGLFRGLVYGTLKITG